VVKNNMLKMHLSGEGILVDSVALKSICFLCCMFFLLWVLYVNVNID